MSVRRIIGTFEDWRSLGEPIVLATVFDTLGSTYTKAGHRILIAANGDYQGLVSGGCLEGDLAERARAVLETAEPAAVTYDMRDDADELWGLGVGCNGLIRVFLQPLLAEHGYEPFSSIARQFLGRARGAAAAVIDAGRSGLRPGTTLVAGAEGHVEWHGGMRPPAGPLADALEAGCRRAIEAGRAEYVTEAAGAAVLYAAIEPLPRVLILGAGLDAIPVVSFAADLGWVVDVADHRPAYLERGGFSRADRISLVDPPSLSEQVALGDYDAILVMSHHLVTDRTYLSQLAEAPARYLGVLGPPARRARLLDALGDAGEALRPRLRGPVGLDIGADSPESIALSVVAELQQVLGGRAPRGRSR